MKGFISNNKSTSSDLGNKGSVLSFMGRKGSEIFEIAEGESENYIKPLHMLASAACKVLNAYIKIAFKVGNPGKDDSNARDSYLMEGLKLSHILSKSYIEQKDKSISIYDYMLNGLRDKLPNVYKMIMIVFSRQEMEITTMRLWLHDAIVATQCALSELRLKLVEKAEENIKITIPVNFHSQHGQIISVATILIHFLQRFENISRKLNAIRSMLDSSTLGASNMCGTMYPIISKKDGVRGLGFKEFHSNSVDAIANMDEFTGFAQELAMTMSHVSRLSSDLLRYQSPGIAYITISPSILESDNIIATQRLPIILEKLRSISAHVYGNMHSMHLLQHNVETGIHINTSSIQDLLFKSYEMTCEGLLGITKVMANVTFNKKRLRDVCKGFAVLSGDIIKWLIYNISLSYDEAYECVQKIIRIAQEKKKKFSLLTIEELQECHPKINSDIYSVLLPLRVMTCRRGPMGTNSVSIRKFLKRYLREFSESMNGNRFLGDPDGDANIGFDSSYQII